MTTQTITAELQHWVDDQISAGHSRPELLQSMIIGGWDVLMAELRQWASAFGTVI